MDVLKKINRLRLERKWSVYRLANEAGLAQSTIINMFNRETLPSITTLESICNAFRISLSEFFAEETGVPNGAPDEAGLLAEYNRLTAAEKKLIYDLICELAQK